MKSNYSLHGQLISILVHCFKRVEVSLIHYVVLASIAVLVGTAANAAEVSNDYYRVVPGDTLWDISERYYGTPDKWPHLQQLNAIAQPTQLLPNTLVDLGTSDPFPLTVLYRAGEAWLIEGDNQFTLQNGDTVNVGDVVQTGAGSITLQMRDGARAVLPSNSRVVLQREGERGITFRLEEGEVESYVPTQRSPGRAYTIETKTGFLGVRGTHFQARYEDNTLLTSVYDGQVTAQSRVGVEQAAVDNGEGARIGIGGDVQVVQLLPPPEEVRITSLLLDDVQIEVLYPSQNVTYRAQIAKDPHFLNILRDQRSLDGQLRFTGLQPGFYHLRLSAVDRLGIEGRSAFFVVHHNDRHVAVIRESSEGHQEGSQWLFEWSHQAQTSYRLQLAADSEFNRVLLDHVSQHNGPLRVSRLPANDIYWRVVSTDNLTGISEVIDTGTLNDSS
ncbi:FecR family protein [Halomonas alkaliantarctica]|uniref:FecR family protein n=1 Tax=Halomonas alkaliantarctica TaxID=232346 RepID=UPI002657C05F|nr:FecR domain-containing protein [Halomonas alkaliantarctica]